MDVSSALLTSAAAVSNAMVILRFRRFTTR